MKITALRRQKRKRDRVNVHVDGEFLIALPEEVVLRRRLRIGATLDQDLLDALRADGALWTAKEKALLLLSYRQRSEQELRQRLLGKGFAPGAVEECVDQLRSGGLIDDQAFAAAFIRDRLRSRPSGRFRIIGELRAKGIDAEMATDILDQVQLENGESEVDLARKALRKFRPRPGDEYTRTKRRLYAFLSRRGFSAETVSRVMDEFLSTTE